MRRQLRHDQPGWHNAPVAAFGPIEARVLVVGLAPGLKGANRTGRPFTGDDAGGFLYATLRKAGFATGTYAADGDDDLALEGCRVTNAVRCLPPGNKPTGSEIAACRPHLAREIAAMADLRAIVALGRVAHGATLSALGHKASAAGFGHGAVHCLDTVTLFDSYHCSRYNTNTGRLTAPMFERVFDAVRSHLRG
ncbi:uracil-DNA glycosylase [Oleomonas cavernae]|uniref:uracil-DNA glycosylase n=1 Tax=Oleomonas cavernae TaxID=2320859 RepID=UPI001F34C741|nr:uracil-DNA glycosylase [Oleomonas cavernae]